MKNVLMVGAHYDDVDLAAGGTAAKLSNCGIKVYKLTLTDNYVPESKFNKLTRAESSEEENKCVCQMLGITNVKFEKEENCNLTYTTKVMKKVEEVIVKYDIDTIFMHSEYDMNHDHTEAAKICKVAARHVSNIYGYRSNIYVTEHSFEPRVFFDISDYIEIKKKALAIYGPEHNRSMACGGNQLFENTIYQNKIWGYSIDTMYAEAFEVIKEVH